MATRQRPPKGGHSIGRGPTADLNREFREFVDRGRAAQKAVDELTSDTAASATDPFIAPSPSIGVAGGVNEGISYALSGQLLTRVRACLRGVARLLEVERSASRVPAFLPPVRELAEGCAGLLAELDAAGATPKFQPGVCRACGCTETRACEGGCSWADAAQTLCSKCNVYEVPGDVLHEFVQLALDVDSGTRQFAPPAGIALKPEVAVRAGRLLQVAARIMAVRS